MKTVIFVGLIVIIIFVNGAAIVAARAGMTKLHRVSRLFGVAGFVSLLVAALAVAHAFTQIWAAEPGYAGLPVLMSSIAVVFFSVGSIIVATLLRYRRTAHR
jgi:hypothetical protein